MCYKIIEDLKERKETHGIIRPVHQCNLEKTRGLQ